MKNWPKGGVAFSDFVTPNISGTAEGTKKFCTLKKVRDNKPKNEIVA